MLLKCTFFSCDRLWFDHVTTIHVFPYLLRTKQSSLQNSIITSSYYAHAFLHTLVFMLLLYFNSPAKKNLAKICVLYFYVVHETKQGLLDIHISMFSIEKDPLWHVISILHIFKFCIFRILWTISLFISIRHYGSSIWFKLFLEEFGRQ
jgi:hypothetical protein